MDDKINDFMDKLREKSGCIKSDNPLVCFLYLLMRDELPAGVVTAKVIESLSIKEENVYTNGYLANYAKYLAKELRNEF